MIGRKLLYSRVEEAHLCPAPSKGVSFFSTDTVVNYNGGPVILSANQDGTGNIWVDDKIIITVTHPDGSTSTFTDIYYGSGCWGIISKPPTEIVSIFSSGINSVHVEFQDVCGGQIGASSLWLVPSSHTSPCPGGVGLGSYPLTQFSFSTGSAPMADFLLYKATWTTTLEGQVCPNTIIVRAGEDPTITIYSPTGETKIHPKLFYDVFSLSCAQYYLQ